MFSKILKCAVAMVAIAGINSNAESNIDEILGEGKDSTKVYRTPSVTVTSTRASEGKSPLPFSEITKKDIDNRYITSDIPKLLSIMPSIIFSSQNGNGIGYSDIKMRGFDQRRIAVMVNGIPQNDPEDHEVYWIDMPDLASSVENIQVQRGAGLSNYGSPSIGGSINLVTNNFANRKGIKISSGIGFQEFGADDNSIKDNVYKNLIEFSSGLMDNWAVYGRLSKITSEGYRDRSDATLQSYFFSVARFDENLSTQFNFFGGPVNDGLAYNGIPKAHITDLALRRKNYAYGGWAYDSTGKNVAWSGDRSKFEVEEFNQPHFEMLNDWKISDALALQSSLFYYQGTGYFDGSSSWADDYFNGIASVDYTINDGSKFKNSYSRAWVKNKQGGWIPKMIYTTDNNQLTIGGELRIHRSDHYMNLLFAERTPESYDMDYKLYSYNGKRDIYSFFIKDEYQLNENITFFADLQLVHHSFRIGDEMLGSKQVTYIDNNGKIVGADDDLFDVRYTFVNPRFGINYTPTKDMNFYVFAAHTSREPRMKNLYHASETYSGAVPKFEYSKVKINDSTEVFQYNLDNPNAKPEKMLDIEFGMNYHKADYKLNANFYLMDYNDEFVKTGKKDNFGTTLDENASRSRHIGVELSGDYWIINQAEHKLGLWANATYSHNYFIDYDVYFNDNKDKVSLKDNDIAGFPSFMSNFGINYINNSFFVGLTGKYVGEFFTDNYGELLQTNQIIIDDLKADWQGYYADNKVDAYFVFDLDASYTFTDVAFMKTLKLQTQVNNLFNKLYAYSGDAREFFPAAERSIFFGVELGL